MVKWLYYYDSCVVIYYYRAFMRLITEQTEARHGTLENSEETDMTDAVIYNFTELMFP